MTMTAVRVPARARLLGIASIAILMAATGFSPAEAAPAYTSVVTARVLPAAPDDVDVSVSAPAIVKRGSTATAHVTTTPAYTGSVRLWYRTTNSWVKSSTVVTLTDGEADITWKPASSRSYKVVTGAGDESASFTVNITGLHDRGITAAFADDTYASGEAVFLTGKATRSGKAYSGASITIERKVGTSSSWYKLGTIKAASNGTFVFTAVPGEQYVYRARITGTWAYTGPQGLTYDAGNRTLEERADALQDLLGSPKYSIGSVAEGDLPSGVDSARFWTLPKGQLIETTQGSQVSTWVVYGPMFTKYVSLGRWFKKIGLPMKDVRCGLLEDGCLQRFTGGATYFNSSKMSPYTYSMYGTTDDVELLAVARSQKNYEEPSWRKNKYNEWIHGNAAWCSVFTSWAAAASGHSTWIPKKKTYSEYLSALKKSGRLHYSGKPPVGAVALFDWGSGTPTHSGFVTGYPNSSTISTVEGNTSDGTGDPQRGVYLRTRYRDHVWAWYMPSES